MKKKVVLAGKNNLSISQKKNLSELADVFEYDDNATTSDEVISRLLGTDVALINAFTPIDKKVLDACPTLKYIVSQSAGINHVDLDALKHSQVGISWYQSYCARSLAEKAFAFILISFHEILPSIKNVEEGNWDYLKFSSRELYGKTLGILGLGTSGKLLKNYAEAFGMKVLSINSKSDKRDINNLCSESDVISINMSLNNDTLNFVDKDFLNSVKCNVLIINLARGKLINEHDLLVFLDANPNARAMLDVVENEPPSINAPIRMHPRVILTPHIGWNSIEAEDFLKKSIYDDILKNI